MTRPLNRGGTGWSARAADAMRRAVMIRPWGDKLAAKRLDRLIRYLQARQDRPPYYCPPDCRDPRCYGAS